MVCRETEIEWTPKAKVYTPKSLFDLSGLSILDFGIIFELRRKDWNKQHALGYLFNT